MENHPTQLPPELAPAKQKPVLGRFVREVLETAILSVILFLGINAVSARIRVESISMIPALHPGDFVVVNKLAYRFGDPERGDIVVFRLPSDPDQRYIKRVVGLPGEQVAITGGHVYINGQEIVEPYVQVETNRNGTWRVPSDGLFVMGDNRVNSSDSRQWGTVPADNVIGQALLVYWPPEKWGRLGGAAFAADPP